MSTIKICNIRMLYILYIDSSHDKIILIIGAVRRFNLILKIQFVHAHETTIIIMNYTITSHIIE